MRNTTWRGNNTIFRTYVQGVSSGEGKRPVEAVKGREHISEWEEVCNCQSFGGILNDEFIDISFDSPEMYDCFLDMAETNEWKCLALPSTKGGHTYWKRTKRLALKSGKDKKTACGFVVDIHGGATYIPLRVKGVDRFPPDYDILEGEEYQVLPEELYPTTTKINLWGLKEHDGRNDELFRYENILMGMKLDRDTIIRILSNTNRFVFAEPMKESELKEIFRPEAFEIDFTPDLWNERGTLQCNKLGDWLIKQRFLIEIERNILFYEAGAYTRDYKAIHRAMREIVPNIRRQQKAETIDYLLDVLDESPPTEERYICFQNCLYDTETETFTEHDPEKIVTNRIPHDYKPGAYNELADKTLERISCGDNDVRALLEECIGYCMYRSNFLNKAFMLVGEKANGKSTFLKTLACLLGYENISSLDLKDLTDRFRTAMMFSKLANIGDDISENFVADPSQFKKITDGGRVTAEFKGITPFEFNPYCKMIFSANQIPRIKDRTGAVIRRLIFIPFDATFSEGDPNFDPHIGRKLRQEEPLQYLINVGLKALSRLLRKNQFTKSERVEKMTKTYDRDNNPIISWLEETDERDILNQTTAEVYLNYKIYSQDNGQTPMARNQFSRMVCRYLGCHTNDRRIGTEKKVRVFEK